MPGRGRKQAQPGRVTRHISLSKEQEKAHSIKPKELTGDKAYDWGENLESLANNKTIANIQNHRQYQSIQAGKPERSRLFYSR